MIVLRCITAQQKVIAKKVAEQIIDAQAEDMTNRAQCMVFAAMLNAGLSVKTVNRVIAELPDVIKGYGEARKERLGDYDMIQGLIDRGVNVTMTKNEL